MIKRIALPMVATLAATAPAMATVSVIPPPSAANNTAQNLVPGLQYTVMTRPGPQVLHVLTMRPNALLTLAPAQMSGSLSQRATLSSGMAARLATGATAGINADYFDLTTGTPSGVLTTGPRLWTSPEPSRSALVVGNGGALSIGKLTLAGRYQKLDPAAATPAPIQTFRAVNRPLPSSSSTGTVVYTADLGRSTPTGTVTEALITLDGGGALPVNGQVQGTVVAQGTGGGMAMGAGQVVISGKNGSGTYIGTNLVPGSRVQLEAAVAGIAPDAWGAVGGGPMIVQGGVAVPDAGEGFTSSQLTGRTTRTAVGQKEDGTILMVVSEGPQQGVRGYTAAEQADLMVSLGATEAIGFDSGGSSLMALGRQQVVPWSSERPIADGLIASYQGAQISIPTPQRLSTAKGGIGTQASMDVQSPVAGQTTVVVKRRGGGFSSTLLDQSGAASNTPVTINPASLGMRDGPYVITSTLTPADGSAPTTMNRNLTVDSTLKTMTGTLRTAGKGKKRTVNMKATFTTTRTATITVKVVDAGGGLVGTAVSGKRYAAGSRAVTWSTKKSLAAGTYYVQVIAKSSYGTSGLQNSQRLK